MIKYSERWRGKGHVTVFKNLGPLCDFETAEARHFKFGAGIDNDMYDDYGWQTSPKWGAVRRT